MRICLYITPNPGSELETNLKAGYKYAQFIEQSDYPFRDPSVYKNEFGYYLELICADLPADLPEIDGASVTWVTINSTIDSALVTKARPVGTYRTNGSVCRLTSDDPAKCRDGHTQSYLTVTAQSIRSALGGYRWIMSNVEGIPRGLELSKEV